MRNEDRGINGDAQRIEQLGWMLFLKIFSDKDKELELIDDAYQSPIPAEYHWDAWAGDDEGITGDELLSFVNNKLFPALRAVDVATGNKRALIIREVFQGNNNFMQSGIALRKVINKLNKVDFNISQERHLFGEIYEGILKELQSAGKSGEFYTPRAITKFMTDIINPQLGEKVLDPACGTGGFLTCTIEHLKKRATNVEQRQSIQENVAGWEFKPLPYLLATTNLILHDVEVPNLLFDDSLARALTDYKAKDQVDVILANPPFGGAVANNNENNFPLNFRTKESADLFLILMIHLLKPGGRAAIVLPDGSLTGDGVKQRIREKWLTDCNVHTIVRLPNSVFKPYATVATNLCFFEKGKPTEEVWFYEHRPPDGQKSYSKTKPIDIKEFSSEKSWWGNRTASDVAWKVNLATLRERHYDLDVRNPNAQQDELEYESQHTITSITDSIERSEELIDNLYDPPCFEVKWETIEEVCSIIKGETGIKKAIPGPYPMVTLAEERSSHNEYQFDTSAVLIPLVSSTGHGHASLKRIHYQEGKFALGTILCALVPKNPSELSSKYLYYYLSVMKDLLLVPLMKGMANVTLPMGRIAEVRIPIPTPENQEKIVALLSLCDQLKTEFNKASALSDQLSQSLFQDIFREHQ
jgi:type I restriction enzyme M protein